MKWLIFDTETTGLTKHHAAKLDDQPRCIEFGAVLYDDETGHSKPYSRLFNPGIELPLEIVRITGITDGDLISESPFDDLWVSEILDCADGVIAHNLPFDKRVIDSEFKRIGNAAAWPEIQFCSVQEIFPLFGKRITLSRFFEYACGALAEQTHRAIDDCYLLRDSLIAIDFFRTVNNK